MACLTGRGVQGEGNAYSDGFEERYAHATAHPTIILVWFVW